MHLRRRRSVIYCWLQGAELLCRDLLSKPLFIPFLLSLILGSVSVKSVWAGDTPLLALPAETVRRAAGYAAELTFPRQAQAVDELNVPRMAFLKPPGEGPFAALVMMHQCAGVNPAVAQWARMATRRGYAVLLIDSLQQRGVRSVCYGPQAGVNLFRGAQDAFKGAAYLRTFPFIDGSRISFVGFSWGAMVGLIVASTSYQRALDAEHFRSVTAFYPGCFRISRPDGTIFDIVSSDILQPLLVLMGEADLETPAAECVAKLLTAKTTSASVDWHIYPKAGHCWDCKQLDGFTKTDYRGVQIEYRYNDEVTRDSGDRLFKFLAGVLRKPVKE